MANLIKPISFPSIRPPEDQTGFETNVGYEWASRLTQFVQQLTATLDNVINNPASPPGFLMTEDEGLVVNLNCNEMNFVGAGVTATVGGPNKTIVTIPGGGGGGGFLKGDPFTASGNWTCPANVTAIWLTMIGGGGGGSATIVAASGGGAGGTGEYCVFLPVNVIPTTVYPITIGNGGAGLAAGLVVSTAGNPGTSSDFNGVFFARGGNGGLASTIGGIGGGINGGAAGGPVAGVGSFGTSEGPNYYGGTGGSSGSNALGGNGGNGKGAGGLAIGGAGGAGVPATSAGGGGGSATFYGVGGAGGAGNSAGNNAPATSYGTGGGGAGGNATTTVASGSGAKGYVLIQYVA